MHGPVDSWEKGERERRQPTHSTTMVLCEEQRYKPNMPHALWPMERAPGLSNASHTFGLFHDCGICRAHRFNLLRPPHTLLTGCGCSWVPLRTFSTHHLGLGRSGPAHAENTPWRSRLQGVLQHFHVVAMIKRLLESRERHIPPMDSSGL